MKLKEIPTTFIILKKIYYFRGLINFILQLSKSIDAIGYYVFFNWKKNQKQLEKI